MYKNECRACSCLCNHKITKEKYKKKKRLKVIARSIYICVYISSCCVEIRLVQRLLGYYFLRLSPQVSTIE